MEQATGFAHHLMPVYQQLSVARVDKIELAVGTTTTATAAQGNPIAHATPRDGVAGQGFHPTHELATGAQQRPSMAAARPSAAFRPNGPRPVLRTEHQQVAPHKTGTHPLVHQHTVARHQCMAYSNGRRIDGKGIGAHDEHDHQRTKQREEGLQCLFHERKGEQTRPRFT
ncbi:hypothetical protein HMPREF9136_1379 [Prevotella dentalis DSM 3688]|uniref:Uncharacterized protein n=1 Tax=Prevotella dentalis (strain ATCC 49559 / DSM 3688 / JCM 13448 / NCTC 12043 / ES 2772) TaxID=908937 RepID=F9D3F1_PREDD|nr:hypothetical protein HMPREF9136_1379 [Prevotella dentalis DSM 3688]